MPKDRTQYYHDYYLRTKERKLARAKRQRELNAAFGAQKTYRRHGLRKRNPDHTRFWNYVNKLKRALGCSTAEAKSIALNELAVRPLRPHDKDDQYAH